MLKHTPGHPLCAHLFVLLTKKKLKTSFSGSILKFLLTNFGILVCILGIDNKEKLYSLKYKSVQKEPLIIYS